MARPGCRSEQSADSGTARSLVTSTSAPCVALDARSADTPFATPLAGRGQAAPSVKAISTTTWVQRLSSLLALTVALGGILVLASGRWSPGHASARPDSGQAPAARAVSVPSSPRRASRSRVVIRVSPLAARISVDDVFVPNPYVVDREQSAAPHRLRAEADGYKASNYLFTFESDVDFETALEPLPSPGAAQTRSGPTSSVGRVEHRVVIDTRNPYQP